MIRKIRSSDRPEFLRLSEEFYASDAVIAPVPAQYHEAAFAELMRSEEYLQCYLFEQAGEIAGYALLVRGFSREAGGPVVWVDELYVRPAFRGQGIGQAFFAELTQAAPAARYRLEVEPDNLRAQKLYRRMGFSVLPYLQMYRDEPCPPGGHSQK